MADGPAVLIVDDGELGEVCDLLAALGAEYAHLRGSAVPRRLEPPARLFVTTGRRAAVAAGWPAAAAGGPLKLGVVAEDSNASRDSLRRLGFDFLVRPRVHREALRLLLLQSLYAGEERRRDPRVSVGLEVDVRTGLRRRTATLIELSCRGARLLARQPFGLGSRLTLGLPAELTGAERVWLRAKVVRSEEGGLPHAREHVAALAYERLRPAEEAALAAALARCAGGPPGSGGDGALLEDAAPAPDERRRSRRAAFRGEVLTLGDEAERALLGRDISPEGMRVDAQAGLRPGDRLELAIYAAAGESPIAVRAHVLRNDGAAGVALRFEQVSPETGRRIEELVARLPAVEPLQGGECEALGAVVSRVVGAESPELDAES
jgi:PilZ domain